MAWWRYARRSVLLGTTSLLTVALASPAAAEVSTDGSLGRKVTRTARDVTVEHTLGRRRGGNLFHSFDRFGVPTGGSVTFTGPGGIDNVVSRVTGGETSEINGDLASRIPGADFYLVNPAGIVFGPGASLDVSGSFHASTADELRFADGVVFSADLGAGGSRLSMAEPRAFGFLGQNVGQVEVLGSTLRMQVPGETLSLTGGDVVVVGASLGSFSVAPGQVGGVLLAAQRGAGAVPVDPNARAVARDGSVRITASETGTPTSVVSGGFGGSRIRIEGGEVLISGGDVIASSLGDADDTGGIAVAASTLTVEGRATTDGTKGSLQTVARSAGQAGPLSVQADRLLVQRAGIVFSASLVNGNAGPVTVRAADIDVVGGGIRSFTTGAGDAGAVTVNAGGLVKVREGGTISSFTRGVGDAGMVSVEAGRLLIDGEGLVTPIASQAFADAEGNAGTVTINVTDLVEVRNGGQISSSTFGEGDAGNVFVTAERLIVDAEDDVDVVETVTTGVNSQANSTSSGNAGRVVINATGLVEVLNGGQISSSTFAEGNAGGVRVRADRLTVEGNGSERSTGISSNADRGAGGDGGNVTVNVASLLELRNGGDIGSGSFRLAQGDGGDVTVIAGRLLIDSDGSEANTGIFNQAEEESFGDAGSIFVRADEIDVLDGGNISSGALASSSGDAGDVTVVARRLLVDRQGSRFLTRISSDTASIGDAGTVLVRAEDLELRDGGEISSGTFAAEGDAGEVVVEAKRLIIDDEGNASDFTGIATQANEFSGGDAGSVTVRADGLLEVRNGGQISSSSFNEGNAGSVDVRASQVVIRDGGFIGSSGRGTGPAGNVRLEADSLLVADAGIRTVGTGATGGQIVIEAEDLIHLVDSEISSNGVEPGERTSLITLKAPFIILNDSQVESLTGDNETIEGSGEARLLGDVTVISSDSLVAGSSEVEIAGLQQNLGSGLQVAPGAFLDAGRLLRASCAARGAARSSFTAGGRGGLPPAPDRPLGSLGAGAGIEQAGASGSFDVACAAPVADGR